MIPKDGINPQYFLAAFRRRFWYIIIPFFLVFLAAIIYCVRAPKIYKSSALVLVQPQEVPTDYIRPTVTSDLRSRFNTIYERIMSRSRLEELIKKHNLYPKATALGDMALAVEVMRRHIRIDFQTGRIKELGSPPAFEVSFFGKDPVKVRNVATDLTNIFLDENFRLRAEQALGTANFLERELERMREVLRQKEELVREFREKYNGFLPEQKDNNLRILDQLQQHLNSLNTSLQHAEDRKMTLQTQMDRLERMQADSLGGRRLLNGSIDDQKPLSLKELRQQLQTLRSRYSDKHPDVVRLMATIAKLEKELENTGNESDMRENLVTPRSSGAQELSQVQTENLLTELKLLDKDIKMLKKEKEKTSMELEEYRHRIELGPKIEQNFVDLRRDYEMASSNYQSLLQKKLSADLAKNLESTQKGEQFEIQDPANLPLKPYKPNIRKILGMGLMLALGSGFGLAFLREYLDETFWTKKDLESILEIPVLVSIPVIITDREKTLSKIKLVGTVCAVAIMSSVLLYALFMLWRRSPGLLPL